MTAIERFAIQLVRDGLLDEMRTWKQYSEAEATTMTEELSEHFSAEDRESARDSHYRYRGMQEAYQASAIRLDALLKAVSEG